MSCHIRKSDNALKDSFIQFRLSKKSGRFEISTNRFEIETIRHCFKVGDFVASHTQHSCIGIACISVEEIRSFTEYGFDFTPDFEFIDNYSHCDIYMKNLPAVEIGEPGEPESPKISYKDARLLSKWKWYKRDEILSKKDIKYPTP